MNYSKNYFFILKLDPIPSRFEKFSDSNKSELFLKKIKALKANETRDWFYHYPYKTLKAALSRVDSLNEMQLAIKINCVIVEYCAQNNNSSQIKIIKFLYGDSEFKLESDTEKSDTVKLDAEIYSALTQQLPTAGFSIFDTKNTKKIEKETKTELLDTESLNLKL